MHEHSESLYPTYDVLERQEEWDDHTRAIVSKRLGPFQLKVLSQAEQEMIRVLAQHLAYEERDEILSWVTAHIDQQLAQPYGESQRKSSTPPQKVLILAGLKALNKWAKSSFSKAFLKLDVDQQFSLISSLQLGHLAPLKDWDASLQQDLFKKLVGLVMDAYYAHPWVWSEIGFGGPAYPRGYVRVELGLTDPWEARGISDGK